MAHGVNDLLTFNAHIVNFMISFTAHKVLAELRTNPMFKSVKV